MTRRDPVMSLSVIALLVIGIAIVGGMDAEDEQKQQEFYCNMVEQGVWPDYNESYQRDCLGGKENE